MKKLKKLLLVLTVVSAFTLNTIGAFAHGLHHHNEGTVFSVEYDDGSPVKGAIVLVYDEAGEQIHEGKTGDDGSFDYGQIEGAAKVVANDGNGHQAEFEMETPVVVADTETEETKEEVTEEITEEVKEEEAETQVEEVQDNSKMITVIVVLAVLGTIAGVFYARNKNISK